MYIIFYGAGGSSLKSEKIALMMPLMSERLNIQSYECLVMPFSLTNAPRVFQAEVNEVLWGLLNKLVFCIFGCRSDLFKDDEKIMTA